jgi:Cytochrome c oxidase subunit IV
LFTGPACATAAIGAAIGWWLFLIGMLFVVLSAIGFVFEYYRGVYAH